MLFRKKDEATKLIELQRSDQKKLDGLQKKLESLRPKWTALQAQVEQLVSLEQAYNATFRGPLEDGTVGGKISRTCESFFRERGAEHNQVIETACQARDNLTYDTVRQIEQTMPLVRRRLLVIADTFGSWCAGVTGHRLSGGNTPQCSDQLREELEGARKKAQTITDMADLLKFISETVERFEEEPLQFVPLLNLDVAIQKALTVEIPWGVQLVKPEPVGHFDTKGPGLSW